ETGRFRVDELMVAEGRVWDARDEGGRTAVRGEILDRSEYREKFEQWLEFIAKNHHGANHRTNPDVAFAPLKKPLSESTVALVGTAGVHLDDQEPFHVETVAGDPTYRLIPDDVDMSRLRFTHTHYDTAPAEEDPNVVFPLDRLHEAEDERRIGGTTPVHIGMMGFNPDPSRVADETAPAVAKEVADAGADVVVLVPG
ncbi:MAG: glycine/sarcosine/betaine reductase selenoprotein B family protein, partial [Halobacteriales archaeon]|nr:glycine/sarcosine/betaine reductase selenoprotein B family protein [Halobacteriales archaeon]